ncbi:DMT family transporter [Alicyclobacillaceae bacterium I2511]|nr:DMT family transporter [Alicyclobacillaceae bacterium I2511]
MITAISLLRTAPKWIRANTGSHLWTWFFGMLSIMLAAAIWGYSNVVIRQGETAISPSVFLWARFAIAGIVMSPVLARLKLRLRDWCLGLGTGVLLGLSVLVQAWAMMTVPVDEVAFIMALYVVFTPLGVSWLQKKWPSPLVWSAVGVSFAGVALLIGRLTLNLHIGLFWALLAAMGASGQIIGTTSMTNRVTSVQLAGLQSVGAGFTMTLAVMIQGVLHPSVYEKMFHWSYTQWFWIGYLAIFATIIAVFLQAWGQTRISATEAALAFNMEPVWTAVFAWLILLQGMTYLQMIGAALIISSLTLISKPAKKNRQTSRISL